MSLVSEPTSLDTPDPMADYTQNAFTDLSVSLGSETLADSASRSQPVTAWHSNFKPKIKKCFYFPTFLLTNIRGGFASKLDELQVLLSDNNVDIAVITETWLNDDIDANILQATCCSGWTVGIAVVVEE